MTAVVNADGPRPPLGLPPGSIRAVLSILICAQLWLLLGLPPQYGIPLPLNLYFLLALVMVFFVSHGGSITSAAESSGPLYMPRGLIRAALVIGTVGVVGYQAFNNHELLLQRLTPTPEQIKYWPRFLAATGIGFLAGILFRPFRLSRSPLIQTMKAWFAIIAMIAMTVEVMMQVFINPHIDREIDLPLWQSILTGMVTFYFSIRS